MLLDTCTLFWLTSNQSELSARAISLIRESAGALFVSSISAYELSLKYRDRKLDLPQPPAIWFPKALTLHGVSELPVTSQIALVATSLSSPHRDPFDRLIAATALVYGMPLLTPDAHFASFANIIVDW